MRTRSSNSGRARWTLAAWVLALCGAFAFAQGDKPAPAPGAQAGTPSASQQKLDEILARYEKALAAWEKTLDDVKTAEEYSAANEKRPGNEFLDELEPVAREAKGTPTAAQAWAKYAEIASILGNVKQVATAVKILVEEHVDSPLLSPISSMIANAKVMKFSEGEPLIRRLIEKSPDKAVQASAMFVLGTKLLGGKSPKPERVAEGRALLEKLQKDYAGVKTLRGQEYAAVAEGYLFELDYLQIGKTPPDFEVTDENGVKFKLSDYRGKVVVIDFWGNW
jgi:hypothetical protein